MAAELRTVDHADAGGDAVAIEIVEDVPSGRLAWHQFVRFFAVLLGAALVVIGLSAAALPLLTVAALVMLLASGDTPSDITNDWQPLAISAVVAWIGLWLGVRLIRGRRRLGLYLRKFGFAGTTQTVSRALRSAVGRSTRLVTLDDSATPPIGVGAGRRVLQVVLVVSIGLVLWLIYSLKTGAFDVDAQDIMQQASDQAGDSAADQISAGIGGALAFGIIQMMAYILALLLISLVAAVTLFTLRAARRASRAQRQASRALQTQQQVGPAARQLADAARYVFAPRLMVVTVPTAFWQKAISGFMDVVDLVIVDVSQPTDALLWEVGALKSRFGGRWILVGQRDLVAKLAATGTAALGTADGQLARMLDGETILAYGPADTGQFARALRKRLVNLPRR
jgi:hypothetical protein